MRGHALLAALVLLAARPAVAQPLAFDIRDGLVTLQATNVPVWQVLASSTPPAGGGSAAGPPGSRRQSA